MKSFIYTISLAALIFSAVACSHSNTNEASNVNAEVIAAASENAQPLFEDHNNEVASQLKNDGVKYSYEYEQKAEEGDLDAMQNIANMYAYGIDVAPDRRKAYRYYNILAQHGNMQAQAIVGYMMLYGFGPIEDTEKGLQLIADAANKKCGLAFYFLGMFYAHNLEQSDDIRLQAKLYFSEAAKLGIEAANNEFEAINNRN
ncbi:MAG: sel1 repeat family protein [Bacteroidales bacterium]|nr:sel1 repeat family protein [Bacteroidales bacterium]